MNSVRTGVKIKIGFLLLVTREIFASQSTSKVIYFHLRTYEYGVLPDIVSSSIILLRMIAFMFASISKQLLFAVVYI